MVFTLGIEYFKNETGKEFDGAVINSDISAKDITEATEKARSIIKSVRANVAPLLANIEAMKKNDPDAKPSVGLNDGQTRELNDFADIFALQLCSRSTGFDKISQIVRGDSYWFHVFVKKEMESRPVGMFDTDPAAELTATPKSFEEIMSEAAAAGTTQPLEYAESYLNREGDDLAGVPDFWQVQAGLH
jgi:hypothetical protein